MKSPLHRYGLLFIFLTLTSQGFAYVQIERSPGWAVIVEIEDKIYFQECGPSQLKESILELDPDSLMRHCRALSAISPYRVSLADYKDWTSAFYGVATRPRNSDNSSRVSELAKQRISEIRTQKESDAFARDFEILLELENGVFRYLGSAESLTLRKQSANGGLLFALVSGFEPTYSNGKVVLKILPPEKKSDACPAHWAPASFSVVSNIFYDSTERSYFEEWRTRSYSAPKLFGPSESWIAWRPVLEKKYTSDGKLGWIFHESLVAFNLSRNSISYREAKNSYGGYGLCVRGRLPWERSSYPKGPLSLKEVADHYGISEAEFFRWAMADDSLGELVTILTTPYTGITEEAYQQIKQKLDGLMGTGLPNYYALQAIANRNPLHADYDKQVAFYQGYMGPSAKRRLTLCNDSPYTKINLAIALYWASPLGWTTHFWFEIKKNECIPLFLRNADDFFYLFAFSTEGKQVVKRWEGGTPLGVKFGTIAIQKNYPNIGAQYDIWDGAGAVAMASERKPEVPRFEDLIEQANTESIASVNFSRQQCPQGRGECRMSLTSRGFEYGYRYPQRK